MNKFAPIALAVAVALNLIVSVVVLTQVRGVADAIEQIAQQSTRVTDFVDQVKPMLGKTVKPPPEPEPAKHRGKK